MDAQKRTSDATSGTERSSAKPRPWWIPESFRGYRRAWLTPDIIAGITLAAVSIPECMGYTKIAGMPVVTGLYTILLPIIAFALLGSSRHLVVGADSATAAILFAGLVTMAHPESPKWVALAGASALIAGLLLFLASLLRLGFLANFLSRTVLVGFLSGVGVSLIFGQLPEILHVDPVGKGTVPRLIGTIGALPHSHLPTVFLSIAVVAVILILERISHRIPGSLIAVVLAIAATSIFHLEHYGISVVGEVRAGLPALHLPKVSLQETMRIFPMTISMFLVILAQSAATSRSFAQKYNEELSEDRDLVALGAANLLAGLSRTFIVNGSPTKTAVADSAGARTQVAQITTAALTVIILLFATSLIAELPNAALASLVLLIGVHLVDIRSLRQIYHFRKATFAVALATLLSVVVLGVERGIFIAIALSIVDHLRQEYRPKDVILTSTGSHWRPVPAAPGVESAPGVMIYRFEAPLFFANADYFTWRIKQLADGASRAVDLLILDLISVSDIDYTAGLMFLHAVKELQSVGVTIAIAEAADVRLQLDRLGITEAIGIEHIYPSITDAMTALSKT
jgi:high affinity sulfate transporter 1